MRAAEPGARPGTGDADLNWHRPSPRLLRARRAARPDPRRPHPGAPRPG